MGYKIIKFQNTSGWSENNVPTIVITKNHPEWKEIYQNWINGKNPTNSKEWKKGVFACTELILWRIRNDK